MIKIELEWCRDMEEIVEALTPESLQNPRIRARLHAIRKTLDRLLEQASRAQPRSETP